MNLKTMYFHLREMKIHTLESKRDSLKIEIEAKNLCDEGVLERKRQIEELEVKISKIENTIDLNKIYTQLGMLIDRSYSKRGGFYGLIIELAKKDEACLTTPELDEIIQELGLNRDEVLSEIKREI